MYDETSTQTLHFGKEILNIEKSNVVHISLEHSETGNVYREFKIKNGAIVFPELPNGNYFFEIQIKGYSRYSKTLKLNSNYISASYKNRPNSWSVDVHLSKNKDLEFYPFNVRLVDTNGNPLSDFKYSMGKIEPFYGGLKTDESGYLKYQFEGKENSSFYISYEDDLGNSYQKEITFENVNKNLIVTIDYTNKIMPTNKEINTPNLLDVYYVDFGYGLERKITAESGVFTSVSSAEGTELYDVLVKTDIDLSDKNVVISIPSGAGGTCNNIMGRDLSFKASKGVYTISIYYPDGTLLNFVDIDIAKSDTFNLNFSQ
ncbi:MAG: hypothetical protein K2P09_03290 [Erysipelotrichales bacterium]|uniref:hypothetical protein n=1 Tax=Thomasclavelia cocleata TaxID=69824 RepID=UPI0023BB68E0|nr:hypothetical protein [Thomasclavelia cocleata]MDE6952817.1 hypothetical protein [Erysipelotrichales bacterium]